MNTINSTVRLNARALLATRAQLSPLVRRVPRARLVPFAAPQLGRIWNTSFLDHLQLPSLTRHHE